MAIITIGYFDYDENDYKKSCPDCGGMMYDDPSITWSFSLSESQRVGLIAGEWGVCVCPKCGRVDYWEF